jgi:hypothetical protein
MSLDKMFVGKMSLDKMSVCEMSVDKMSVYKMSEDNMSVTLKMFFFIHLKERLSIKILF